MEQHVSFFIFINYRGHHRKAVAIYNATSQFTTQSLVEEKNVFFEHNREVQTKNL
jgi:hypothetical protein